MIIPSMNRQINIIRHVITPHNQYSQYWLQLSVLIITANFGISQDGSVVQFKIKKHTPLRKLMQAYCDRQVMYNNIVFTPWLKKAGGVL